MDVHIWSLESGLVWRYKNLEVTDLLITFRVLSLDKVIMRISVDGENIPILGGSEKEEFIKRRLRRSEH